VNEPITITATLPAWITTNKDVDRFLAYVQQGKNEQAMRELYFYPGDMSKGNDPWTLVGEAEISVRLQSRDDLVTSRLKTLQQNLEAARAEWLTKQQHILEQINKLQALPMAEVVEASQS
jgi:hypothetical protein